MTLVARHDHVMQPRECLRYPPDIVCRLAAPSAPTRLLVTEGGEKSVVMPT